MQIRRLLYVLPIGMILFAVGCNFNAPVDYNRPTRGLSPVPPHVISESLRDMPQTEISGQPVQVSENASKSRRPSMFGRGRKARATTPILEVPTVIPVQQNTMAGQILGTHETTFNAKEESRSTNITLAAESIHGKVIQPGEIFSFNEAVGPTIERRGYEKGMIYIDGEKSEGFGGGVCQVSTTLHQAAVDAGMTITERHDHSLPVGYAKSGEEAATSYGVIDFKFQNEKDYPVVIHSSVSGGTLRVAIHGA